MHTYISPHWVDKLKGGEKRYMLDIGKQYSKVGDTHRFYTCRDGKGEYFTMRVSDALAFRDFNEAMKNDKIKIFPIDAFCPMRCTILFQYTMSEQHIHGIHATEYEFIHG